MSFEPSSPQDIDRIGKLIPRIFVGVGGVGGRILKRIQGLMDNTAIYRDELQSVTGYFVVDTNKGDLDRFPSNGPIKTFSTKRAYTEDNLLGLLQREDPGLLRWLPADYAETYRPGNKGAGQIRMESRVSFYVNSGAFRSEFERLVDSLTATHNAWRAVDSAGVEVHLFATLAGGTGSGCFLPVAYTIREVLKQRGFTPTLFGTLLTSDTVKSSGKVGREVWPRIDANTYAALKELEHLGSVDAGHPPIEFVHANPEGRPFPMAEVGPFNWIALVGKPTKRSLDSDEIWAAVAETAYLNLITGAAVNQDSASDNYTQYMRKPSHPKVEVGRDISTGYTRQFGAHGAAALVAPKEELLDYCTLRFQAELLRNQFDLPPAEPREGRTESAPLPKEDFAGNGYLRYLNQRWRKRFLDHVHNDKDKYPALKEAMLAAIRDPGEAEQTARSQLEYASKLRTVTGSWFGEEPEEKAKKKSAFKKDATEGGAAQHHMSMLKRVEEGLKGQRSRITLAELDGFQFNRANLANGQFESFLTSAANKAKDDWKRIQATDGPLDRLCGEVHAPITELKVADAVTMRLLVLELQERAKEWLAQAEGARSAAEPNLVEGDWEPQVEDLTRQIKPHMNPGTLARLQDAIGHGATEILQGLTGRCNDKANSLAKRTGRWLEASIQVRQLESLLQFLEARADTFAQVTDEASDRAADLEVQAKELESAGLRTLRKDNNGEWRPGELGCRDFVHSVELLKRPGSEERFWSGLWDVRARERLEHAFGSGGALVNDAFVEAEAKARPEGRVSVDHVLQRFETDARALAEREVLSILNDQQDADGEITPGLLQIHNLLEFEALVGIQNQDLHGSALKTAVEATERDLHGTQPHRKEEVRRKLEDWIAAKMRELVGMTGVLATFNRAVGSKDQMPFQDYAALVANKATWDTLRGKYENGLKIIQEKFGSTPIDERTWEDPSSLFVFRAVRAAPIYAFEGVIRLHDSYQGQQSGRDPKHARLHTDARWEDWDALYDLDIASRDKQGARKWPRDERAFLARLVSVGIIRLRDGSWSLEIPSRRGDDYVAHLGRLTSEANGRALLTRLYEELGRGTTGSGRRKVAEDVAKKAALKPGLAAAVTRDIEGWTEQIRLSGAKDTSLLDDLEALGSAIDAETARRR